MINTKKICTSILALIGLSSAASVIADNVYLRSQQDASYLCRSFTHGHTTIIKRLSLEATQKSCMWSKISEEEKGNTSDSFAYRMPNHSIYLSYAQAKEGSMLYLSSAKRYFYHNHMLNERYFALSILGEGYNDLLFVHSEKIKVFNTPITSFSLEKLSPSKTPNMLFWEEKA